MKSACFVTKFHIEKSRENRQKKGRDTMKQKRLKSLFLMLVLLTTIALSGCSGDKSAEDSASNITIGIPQDLEDTLDPHKVTAAGSKEVLFNIYEGLVKPDADGNLNAAVASDYVVSEDGLTYTFTLRDGIKFHDGNPVTVEDVIYSIERCADTSNGDPLVPAFSNIAGIEATDDKTVTITLTSADSDFVSYMTTAIIPKSNEEPDTNPIGTGPYKYVSRSPQEEFVVEKFADYWGTPANIENVTFKIVADADSIVTSLNGGSIDMYCRITADQAEQLSGDFEVYEGTMNLVQALYLNNAEAPFNDVKVRQALCYAVDEQGVLDMISNGKGAIIGSAMYPSFGKYYMEELNNAYPTDVDKAKALLSEAGYADGFDMTITVPSNYQPHIDTAQVLVEQLKAINVNATIELIEWDSWLSDVYTGRQFQSTVIGVDATNLTARALLERYNSDASGNFINFTSDNYNSVFEQAIKTTDDATQTELWKECQTILSEEAASVYIQDLPEFVALNKKFGGYEFYPLYVQDVSKLYINEDAAE